jgi:hypothetical protein
MLSAWDSEVEDLVVIRRGQADTLRERCRSGRLVCPIVGCSAPAFTTRRLFVNRWGTEVIDGFRHLVAPDDAVHTPESVRHQEGKAQVAAWLKALGLRDVSVERSVTVGHRPASGKARVRRPDVKAITRDGERLAVEIQVSPITEDLWRRRTSDLAGERYKVIWLWTWKADLDRVNADTTALRSQITQAIRPWFLDPQHDEGPRLAATHQVARVGGERFVVPPFDPQLPLDLTWRALSEHHLEGTRIAVGAGDVDDSAAYASARERTKTGAHHDVTRHGSNGGSALPPPLDSKALARQERRDQERQARAAARGPAPEIGALPPRINALCEQVQTGDDRIWVAPVTWKSAIAWKLLNRPAGVSIPIHGVIEWVEKKYPCDKNTAVAPVRNFLRSLERAGALNLTGTHAVILSSVFVPISADGTQVRS